jgi:putative flippase GtrA
MGIVKNTIKKHSKRITKYAIVGASGFFIDAGFLYLLTQYGHIWYIFSEAIATLIAFLTNYTGNTLWTYRDAMKKLESSRVKIRSGIRDCDNGKGEEQS